MLVECRNGFHAELLVSHFALRVDYQTIAEFIVDFETKRENNGTWSNADLIAFEERKGELIRLTLHDAGIIQDLRHALLNPPTSWKLTLEIVGDRITYSVRVTGLQIPDFTGNVVFSNLAATKR